MKFLSDLVGDILDAGEKIVRSPLRIYCVADEHTWELQLDGSYKCKLCGKTLDSSDK